MLDTQPRLWTRDFTLITLATAIGAAGWIAGGFALSFLVFDETGSTLAAALVVSIELIPHIVVPMLVAPIMDRLPRKTFLVAGDLVNGVAYALMGLWLMHFNFAYEGYLLVSLVLSSLGAIDELAYSSLYPELIPRGAEERGYAISGMLYPTLIVIMTPLSAFLLDTIGVPVLLLIQGALSMLAAGIESFISHNTSANPSSDAYSFKQWREDLFAGINYAKGEKGLQGIYAYVATTNAVATGYQPILVAFFRTAPGMTVAMYAMLSVLECIGRSLGAVLKYKHEVAPNKRFGLMFFVYQLYDISDIALLWLPYPLMLVDRFVCGFFGAISSTLRTAAVQSYIPEQLRARINAFEGVLYTAVAAVFSLITGALGEIFDLRIAMSIIALVGFGACWLFIWGGRRHVRKVYEYEVSVS